MRPLSPDLSDTRQPWQAVQLAGEAQRTRWRRAADEDQKD